MDDFDALVKRHPVLRLRCWVIDAWLRWRATHDLTATLIAMGNAFGSAAGYGYTLAARPDPEGRERE